MRKSKVESRSTCRTPGAAGEDGDRAASVGHDWYEEGGRIADAWEEQAEAILGLDGDQSVCVGMAARILHQIGMEFLPQLDFQQPVKLDSRWEAVVGLETLYAKGCHLPDKLRTLFGDAYGANLLDIIRDGVFIGATPEATLMVSGYDSMAAIIPPRPSLTGLLTVLSITPEWRRYMREIAQGFAGLADWISRRPPTAERMCRLLVHGCLLASSLLECIVLFEYAAWRSTLVINLASGRKPEKARGPRRRGSQRKRASI